MMRRWIGLGLGVVAIIPTMPAVAEESGAIVVTAPRTVPLKAERSPYTGAAVATTTLTIPVLYNDLDLTQPRDQARLLTRVDQVAISACRQLDRMFPLDPDPLCVGRAAATGQDAARERIAAAAR